MVVGVDFENIAGSTKAERMKRWFENPRVVGNLALIGVLPGFFWRRARLYLLGFVISAALYVLVMLFRSAWYPQHLPSQSMGQVVGTTFAAAGVVYAAVMVGPLIAGVVDTMNYRETRRRAIRAGYRLCGHCLHDLSGGAESGVCTECGKSYDAASVEEAWRRVLRGKERQRDESRDLV